MRVWLFSTRLKRRPVILTGCQIMPAAKLNQGSAPGDDAGEPHWVYGWTHFRMTGQTVARMDKLTRVIEVKDCQKWIRCAAGSAAVFTPNSETNSFHRQSR